MGIPAKDIQAIERRKRSGHEGKTLEKIILASQNGVRITQVPQASRTICKAGKAINVRVNSPCDFFGSFVGTGRLIVCDAKESSLARRLQTSEDHLPEHQRMSLIVYGQAGAVAGLIVMHPSMVSGLHWISWVDWRQLLERRPSILYTDMHHAGTVAGVVDWSLVLAAADA